MPGVLVGHLHREGDVVDGAGARDAGLGRRRVDRVGAAAARAPRTSQPSSPCAREAEHVLDHGRGAAGSP